MFPAPDDPRERDGDEHRGMTETIRATTAADFLGLVPHLAGYTPSDSLVLVPFRGSRTVGLMRLDLPRPDADVDGFASALIGMVCRVPEADAVAVVAYTSEPWQADLHADLFDGLAHYADACGLRLVDALCVARDGWANALDAGATLQPLSAISTELTTVAPPAPGDQSSGVLLERASERMIARVDAALTSLDDALQAVIGDGDGHRGAVGGIDPRALRAIEALDQPDDVWEAALGWSLGPEPDHLPGSAFGDAFPAAMLLWVLARPGLRDVVLAQWCHGPEAGSRALVDQLRWESGEPFPSGPLFLAGEGPRPDADRLLRARRVTVRLAALASGRHRAAALAVAAWLSWALGLGTHAEAYAREALVEQPGHGLADIVRELSARGHLPEWSFHPVAPGYPDVDVNGRAHRP